VAELKRLASWLSSALGTLACSGSPALEGDKTVSFERDLAPKFAASCGLSSSCHALPPRDHAPGRVFLGCQAGSPTCADPSPDAVYTGLFARSQQLPSMPYVTPGDPWNSYLQRKLDGDLAGLNCSEAADESAPPCGESMPPGDLASATLRSEVRAWIVDGGAKN